MIDWYNERGRYGLIRGDDGGTYFVHHSNHPPELNPQSGLRVTFRARPRLHGKRGMEAYEVSRYGSAVSDEKSPNPAYASLRRRTRKNVPSERDRQRIKSRDSVERTQAAANEALRLKLARRQGLLTADKEKFPPGTRVRHWYLGEGTVELATLEIVSVRFDGQTDAVHDMQHDSLSLVGAPAPVIASTRTKVVRELAPSLSRRPTEIGRYMRALANDVREVLDREEMPDPGVYAFRDSIHPSEPLQPLQIDPRVAQAFKTASNIDALYSHQANARRVLLQGRNLVISTPTASGKTEAYNPTILETLINRRNARALYIFPLVALGFDQTERLRKLNDALPADCRLRLCIYNRDVEWSEKQRLLRDENQIVVTTPDSLHYVFLPKPYPNWKRFFRNLCYIVLDEAHVYKGVLGANMANIVRRLLVRCRREGNPRFPQVIVSSATVRKPAQLAHQLTGLDPNEFAVIDQSGAPQPGRHLLVTRSDIHELESVCADLLQVTTVDVATQENRPVSIIVFVRSISGVKRATERLRKWLRKNRRADLCALVEDYYSEKADKKNVMERLRSGRIRCVFTTSALMAGIDIGDLDVAIIEHFPGLVMDVRQMFGRAGRVGEGAAILFAKRADPFDQFYFERPDLLFQGPIEDVIANPENPYLLAAHLKCAAHTNPKDRYNREGPLSGRYSQLFGRMGRDLLDYYVRQGDLLFRSGCYFLNDGEPHDDPPLNNLRSMDTGSFTLMTESGMKLEQKRRTTAFRDAHPGALVWCGGNRYRVTALSEESKLITCCPVQANDQRTQGIEQVVVQEIGPSIPAWGFNKRISLWSGEVEITTAVNEYLLYQAATVMRCRNLCCRHETNNLDARRCPICGGHLRPKQVEKVLETYTIDQQPPLSNTLKTRACRIEPGPGLLAKFENDFWPRWSTNQGQNRVGVGPTFDCAVHSLEHALLKAFPERVRCDRDEISGLSLPDRPDQPTRLYLYDNFPGGLGLADEFSTDPSPFIKDALEIIERCTCEEDSGCPVCLAHYGCNRFNSGLSKLAGRYLCRLILDMDTDIVVGELVDYVNTVFPPGQIVEREEISETMKPEDALPF